MVKTITCLDLFLCVFYILINLFTICKSNVKTWNSNIDFNNPRNWNLDRIPCDSDRILFPENFAIYLDFKLKAREIVSYLTISLTILLCLLSYVFFCFMYHRFFQKMVK
jgi:hypothetical protein